MRGRKRKEIRKLARQATQRARGMPAPEGLPAALPDVLPPPPGPTPAPTLEMLCVCGETLRIPTLLHQKRCACPSCRRRFIASFTTDRETGLETLTPIYVDDGRTTGGTHLAEALSGVRPRPASRTETILDVVPPEPPPEMPFACPCGARLRARPADYDKRVQCGQCGTRLLLALVYDSEKKGFRIEVLRLSDAPSGETHFLER